MSQSTNRSADGKTRTIDLPASVRHELLRTERRRLALDILQGASSPIDLKDFAAGIAARETGCTSVDDAVERVAIDLHHVHLPKLAEYGVIEYEPDVRLIVPTVYSIDDGRMSGFDRR